MHLSTLQSSANAGAAGCARAVQSLHSDAVQCKVQSNVKMQLVQTASSAKFAVRCTSANCKLLRHGENRAGAGPGQVEAGCRPNAIQLYMDIQIQIHI